MNVQEKHSPGILANKWYLAKAIPGQNVMVLGSFVRLEHCGARKRQNISLLLLRWQVRSRERRAWSTSSLLIPQVRRCFGDLFVLGFPLAVWGVSLTFVGLVPFRQRFGLLAFEILVPLVLLVSVF